MIPQSFHGSIQESRSLPHSLNSRRGLEAQAKIKISIKIKTSIKIKIKRTERLHRPNVDDSLAILKKKQRKKRQGLEEG